MIELELRQSKEGVVCLPVVKRLLCTNILLCTDYLKELEKVRQELHVKRMVRLLQLVKVQKLYMSPCRKSSQIYGVPGISQKIETQSVYIRLTFALDVCIITIITYMEEN